MALGSVRVAQGPVKDVAPGSEEVAQGLAAPFCLPLACPKIYQSASRPMQEDVASDSVEVAPGLAEDVAPALGSEEIVPGLGTSFYLSLACPKTHRSASHPPREDVAPDSWLTTGLVENVLLVGE